MVRRSELTRRHVAAIRYVVLGTMWLAEVLRRNNGVGYCVTVYDHDGLADKYKLFGRANKSIVAALQKSSAVCLLTVRRNM